MAGRLGLSASEYCIVTPDSDIYIENYGRVNADIESVWWGGAWDAPPAGVPREQVYRFAAEPIAAEKSDWRREAEHIAEQECRVRAMRLGQVQLLAGTPSLVALGGGGVAAQPVAAAGGAAAAAPVTLPIAGVLQGATAGGGKVAAESKWRAAISWGGYRYGDEVTGHVDSGHSIGARDLHRLPDGSGLFVELVVPDDEEEFMTRAVAADARILPVKRNSGGRRETTWVEQASRSKKETLGKDWTLPGPATAGWCLQFIAAEGMGPDGHHEHFRSVCRLDSQAWGVQEHFQCTQFLKLLLLVDQLDGSNLEGVEAIFRRMRTIEYSHSQKLRETESKGGPSKLSLEEQAVFAGTTHAHTSLMICPDMLEHVWKEVEREASLAKNLVKARENRDSLTKGSK